MADSLILLEQHSAAGSPSLDFTAFISELYDEYLIELVDVVPANNGADLALRVGTGAGPAWQAGTYNWAHWRYLFNTAGPTGVEFAVNIVLHMGVSTAAGWSASGSVRLAKPAGLFPQLWGKVAAFDSVGLTLFGSEVVGAWKSTAPITGVQVLMSAGNIASGTVRILAVAPRPLSSGFPPGYWARAFRERIRRLRRPWAPRPADVLVTA